MTAQLDKRYRAADPDTSLVLSRDFKADREAVFGAFLDAKVLRTIWSVEPLKVVEMTLDPRVGGEWKYTMRDETTGAVAHCTARYIEIQKPRRIAWRSRWVGGPLAAADEGMRVTLEFDSIAGGTRLTVTHELFPDRETRDDQSLRWEAELKKLARFLGEQFR